MALQGVPKPLLPISGKPSLSWIYDELDAYFVKQDKGSLHVVCDAQSYQYFQRWTLSSGLPLSRLLNNGVTFDEGDTRETTSLDCFTPSLEIFCETYDYAESVPTLLLPGDLVCSPSDVRRIVDGAVAHVVTTTTDCLLCCEPSDLYKMHPSKVSSSPFALLLRPAALRSYLESGETTVGSPLCILFEKVAITLEAQEVDLLLPSLPEEWIMQPSLAQLYPSPQALSR